MTGLEYEQVLELEDRVEDYLGGWHPERGRRREMELFDAVIATLFRHLMPQSEDRMRKAIDAAYGLGPDSCAPNVPQRSSIKS
jgi:hypothetical protein